MSLSCYLEQSTSPCIADSGPCLGHKLQTRPHNASSKHGIDCSCARQQIPPWQISTDKALGIVEKYCGSWNNFLNSMCPVVDITIRARHFKQVVQKELKQTDLCQHLCKLHPGCDVTVGQQHLCSLLQGIQEHGSQHGKLCDACPGLAAASVEITLFTLRLIMQSWYLAAITCTFKNYS